jgi:hypothetical protein
LAASASIAASPPAVQSATSEQWGINAAAQAAYAAVSASLANATANGIAATSAQERLGRGATDPWGGGLAVSVLGGAASAADPSGSSSLASASATFLAPAAYQQIVSGRGAPISLSGAAYAAETGGASRFGSANVTLSLPDTAQQIAYAVTLIDADGVWTQTAAPPNNQGIAAYIAPANVTAADAVNLTIANGAVTATQGGALPGGLPSPASIQQAIGELALSSPQSYPARAGLATSAYEGSLTLIKLPPGSNFAGGDNYITFGTSAADPFEGWALVLPQDTVTVTVSQSQTTSETPIGS